ncbi:CheA signal transduction histidine kinase [Turneriella parva DSM 21527]|uniref:Chemotaxis protein CheA n=1 Tax=Turneriella parva (strain ATCC BAA-1111 / DSM 21527 / NCTC 11395 / H) TaxID=869212 RepID=I4B2D7_TURPD|nr:CheA signal transduction histidine kinase [Turneriella parva DSM 21527]
MAVSAEVSAFLEDLTENLAAIEQALVQLEEAPQSTEYLHEVFRAAHTIKGNAAMMNLTNLVALGHAVETALQEVLAGGVTLTRDSIGLFTECRSVMAAIGQALKKGSDPNAIPIRELTDRIQVLLLETGQREAKESSAEMERELTVTLHISRSELAPSVRAFLAETRLAEFGTILRKEPGDDALESPQFAASDRQLLFVLKTSSDAAEIRENLNIDLIENVAIAEGSTTAASAQAQARSAIAAAKVADAPADIAAPASDTVRLSVRTLDQLLNLTGELVITNSGLQHLADEFAQFHLPAEESIKLTDKSREIFRVAAEIQAIVMKARMLPIEHVFSRFKRFVRDYADKSGKALRLEITGAETELDKRVIDEMVKPLTHLIRNALDHGVELPDERIAQGKTAEATLRIAAAQSGSSILISVEDDGRGLNRRKIVERALAKGLVSAERVDSLTDAEVQDFIFMPGFSTKEAADDISGRGFGMDIVRDSIRKLSGDLQITSIEGQGTRMVVKLPLTLAILTALTFRVRNDIFAAPLNSIEESLRVPAGSVVRVQGRESLHVRDEVIPFIRLDRALGYPAIEDSGEHVHVILAEINRHRVAISIDEFLKKQELVVKSLGEHYRHVPGIAGVSMLGDSDIIFIVDLEEIVQMHRSRGHMPTRESAQAKNSDRRTESENDMQSIGIEAIEVEQKAAEARPMTPIIDINDKEFVRNWIAQSNKTAVQGIQMLTGISTIAVKKSKGSRLKAEKSHEATRKILDRINDIILIHLPMLPAAGAIDLVLGRDAAEKMSQILFSAAGIAHEGEFDPSPLLEITNILGSAYTNTLTFLTEKSVEPATPSLLATPEAIRGLIDERLASPRSELLVIENQFRIGDEDIEIGLMIYLTGN